MLCSIGESMKAEYDREYQMMRRGTLVRRSLLVNATQKWLRHANACPICKESEMITPKG